ncbi:MAG: ankyrin repeat domain-containing protein [Oceanicaulis sp.]
MVLIFKILAASLALALGNFAAAQETPPLFAAISERDADAFDAALAAGENVNARLGGEQGPTPLMWAASAGRVDFVEALLEAGADIDARDQTGDSPINYAAFRARPAAVAALLSAGADTTIRGHGNAAEIAARRGNQDVLALVLDARGEGPDRSVVEAALEAAAIADDADTVAALAALSDVTAARDFAGRPVLHAAARAGSVAAIDALIDAGASVGTADFIGYTALMEAAREGRTEAVLALIEAGADIDHVGGEYALHLTALHLAAIENRADTVSALLDAGAQIDPVGVMGGSPLLWAVYEGAREAALVLAEAGADGAIAGDPGTPAVDVARGREWDEVVAALD